MTILLDILTTLCLGLMIGTEFAVSVFINPVLQQLDGAAQGRPVRLFAGRLGTAMPFWYAGSLLLLIAEAIVRRAEPGEGLLIAACLIWVLVIVATLLVLVPIANRLAKLEDGGLSPEAKQEQRKWDRLHRLRVAALVAAMVCLLLAVRI